MHHYTRWFYRLGSNLLLELIILSLVQHRVNLEDCLNKASFCFKYINKIIVDMLHRVHCFKIYKVLYMASSWSFR